jgi:hypothetical protein
MAEDAGGGVERNARRTGRMRAAGESISRSSSSQRNIRTPPTPEAGVRGHNSMRAPKLCGGGNKQVGSKTGGRPGASVAVSPQRAVGPLLPPFEDSQD